MRNSRFVWESYEHFIISWLFPSVFPRHNNGFVGTFGLRWDIDFLSLSRRARWEFSNECTCPSFSFPIRKLWAFYYFITFSSFFPQWIFRDFWPDTKSWPFKPKSSSSLQGFKRVLVGAILISYEKVMSILCFSPFSQGYNKGFFEIFGPTQNLDLFSLSRIARWEVSNECSWAQFSFLMRKLWQFYYFITFSPVVPRLNKGFFEIFGPTQNPDLFSLSRRARWEVSNECSWAQFSFCTRKLWPFYNFMTFSPVFRDFWPDTKGRRR